jgi:hypothetical protein
MEPIKFKLNDVYSFSYNEEFRKNHSGDLYWCFDGQLVVKRKAGDELYLEDTYWISENRKFTLKEAQEKGNLTFKCNLDEVEELNEHNLCYYDDNDIIDLSYQHHCYTRYVLRKGATRSKEKMLSIAKEKIDNAQHKIEYAKGEIKRINETIEKINNGDLNVYL